MKTLRLAVLALACFTPSCNEETGLSPSDLTVPPDLSLPAGDMAMRLPDGVRCATMTCSGNNTCCIRRGAGNTVTQMCMPMGTCGDGGAEAMCDGPEDCSTAQPNCCVSVTLRMSAMDGGLPDPTGGSASCIASCPPSADLSTGRVQSKLCKTIDDCVDYDAGGISFDSCCSSAMVPGVKFCAPGRFASLGGYTCN